jgi:hypothetical protein
VKGIGIKEFKDQKFKEELSWFILEEEVRVDEQKDLLSKWDAKLISGKELRSKLNLFRKSFREEMKVLNHLIGEVTRLPR